MTAERESLGTKHGWDGRWQSWEGVPGHKDGVKEHLSPRDAEGDGKVVLADVVSSTVLLKGKLRERP